MSEDGGGVSDAAALPDAVREHWEGGVMLTEREFIERDRAAWNAKARFERRAHQAWLWQVRQRLADVPAGEELLGRLQDGRAA